MGNLNTAAAGAAVIRAVVQVATKTRLQLSNFYAIESGANFKTDPTHFCPLCKERLLPPIYQCFNGHTLCDHCEAKCVICPQCKDELPKSKRIRNRMLEEVVMELEFDCPYRKQGCLAQLKYGDIKDHCWDCQFAKLPICFHLGIDCDEKHTLKSILSHLKAHEIVQIIFHDIKSDKGDIFESCPIEITQFAIISDLEMMASDQILMWKPYYVKFNGHSFFLVTKYEAKNNLFMWAAVNFGSGQLSKQFFARIKLMPINSKNTALEWQGPVAELRNECDPQKSESYNKLGISLEHLKQLCWPRSSNEHNLNDFNDGIVSWKLHLQFSQKKYEDGEFGWDAEEAGFVIENAAFY